MLKEASLKRSNCKILLKIFRIIYSVYAKMPIVIFCNFFWEFRNCKQSLKSNFWIIVWYFVQSRIIWMPWIEIIPQFILQISCGNKLKKIKRLRSTHIYNSKLYSLCISKFNYLKKPVAKDRTFGKKIVINPIKNIDALGKEQKTI